MTHVSEPIELDRVVFEAGASRPLPSTPLSDDPDMRAAFSVLRHTYPLPSDVTNAITPGDVMATGTVEDAAAEALQQVRRPRSLSARLDAGISLLRLVHA